MRIVLTIVLSVILFSSFAQSLKKEKIQKLVDEYFVEGLTTLKDFLSLPNFGRIYVRLQATGDSQPIEPFISTLGLPAVSVRIPNPDSHIHAPNENLRLGNFHGGLKMCLGILTQQL